MAPRIRERYHAAKAYFLATEAVSRPIALLMAFFAFALIVSAGTGVFLLGRWGYRQIVHVDSPAVVVVPESNNTATDNPSPTTDNKPAQPSIQQQQANSQTTPTGNRLPNTGPSLLMYAEIALAGTVMHQAYSRLKLTKR